MNYVINSNQIGSGTVGKVFQIQNLEPPYNKLIAKIFEEQGYEYYIKEKNILLELSHSNNSNNDYIIKLKNYDITLDFVDYFPYNSNFLIFDYLKHGNLSEYLRDMENFTPISEKYVKLFCYKLLIGLKTIHNNNICHNKMDINNIMLDDDFNPIIIHFSDASKNNSNFRKDFIGLAKVIAKLITSGKFFNIKPANKCFEIIDNFHRMHKDTIFWKMFEKEISGEFIKFFNILVKTKKGLNIDDLIENEWLKEVKNNDNRKEIEENLKKYFKERYEKILYFNNNSIQNIDMNNIITTNNNNYSNNSLFNLYSFNSNRSLDNFNEQNNHYDLSIQKLNYEPKGILFNYIQIILKNNKSDNNGFLFDFMNDFEKSIKKLKEVSDVEWSKDYLSFFINFEDNLIFEEENNNKNNYQDYCFNNDENNDINNSDSNNHDCNDDIFDEDDYEDEPLIIKIDLLKYNKKNSYDIYNDKYYLMFNYVQGGIYNYYYYLKIIREKANSLLNKNKSNTN